MTPSAPATARGARTRAALVAAARTVFERDGFLASRLTDITAEAGCSTGSFYTYFAGKDEIFTAVMEAARDDMLHPGTPHVHDADDPAAVIEASNRAYFEAYRRNAALMRLQEQVATIDENFRRRRLERGETFVRRNARSIEALQARGVADPTLDPLMASRALSAMVSRLAYTSFALGEDLPVEELVVTATRLWCNALGLAAARGARGGTVAPVDTPATSSSPPAPAAVLWDMDGTLVDTEPYWIVAERELVARHGGTWTHEDAMSCVGNDLLVTGATLRDRGGVDLEPREIVELLLDRVVEQVGQEVPWRPGARELLSSLREAGVPCALVTMSWTRLAEPVVAALPEGTFATVVTGDQVSAGKPDPEAYAVACDRLGVAPGRSVAIEDSPTGAASAEAAGCTVLVVPCHVEVPSGPRRVFRDSLASIGTEDLTALLAGR